MKISDDEIRKLAEARGFTCKPWEFAPDEVAGRCPYPPTAPATAHWAQARQLRAALVREIRAQRRAKPKRR